MGMSELLRTANDTSVSEPWPRVHAFNVLRLAFKDKNLSTDSSGFFAEGTPTFSHSLGDSQTSQRCRVTLCRMSIPHISIIDREEVKVTLRRAMQE